jgi:hypothetical protein
MCLELRAGRKDCEYTDPRRQTEFSLAVLFEGSSSVKKAPKLTLSRETVRNLETTDLQAVAGGVTLVCTISCGHVSCLC